MLLQFQLAAHDDPRKHARHVATVNPFALSARAATSEEARWTRPMHWGAAGIASGTNGKRNMFVIALALRNCLCL